MEAKASSKRVLGGVLEALEMALVGLAVVLAATLVAAGWVPALRWGWLFWALLVAVVALLAVMGAEAMRSEEGR